MLKRFLVILGLLVLASYSVIEVKAKQWRDITPLKTTRAEVESLLGKENDLRRYQFENERAYIFYSVGNCGMMDVTEVTEKCRCFVPANVVASIHVTLEVSRKFSSLKIDKRKFTKEWVLVGMYMYSNLIEGVRYTVDERRDEIVTIDYLPAAKDCDALTKTKKTATQYGLGPPYSPFLTTTLANKRLERTRYERASLVSCVGEPLKRHVSRLTVNRV